MKDVYRTATVTALCAAMREQQDYTACPILADALEDAGLTDAQLLTELRASPDRVRAERLVAEIYSDTTQRAVWRMEKIADYLGEGGYPGDHGPMTYELLMTAAHSYADTGDDGLGGGGAMNWSNGITDEECRDFWPTFTAVSGRPNPADDDDDFGGFLKCAC